MAGTSKFASLRFRIVLVGLHRFHSHRYIYSFTVASESRVDPLSDEDLAFVDHLNIHTTHVYTPPKSLPLPRLKMRRWLVQRWPFISTTTALHPSSPLSLSTKFMILRISTCTTVIRHTKFPGCKVSLNMCVPLRVG